MSNTELKHAAKKGKEFPLLAFFGISVLCVILDQVSKYWAKTVLLPVGDIPVWDGVLHLTYAENTGMAFSMLSEHTWILSLATAVLVAAMLGFYFWKRSEIPVFVHSVLAVIIGGGIGNLIDRVCLGYVVDFIYVKIINFAIFNIADSFVVVGCILLVVHLFFHGNILSREEKKAE